MHVGGQDIPQSGGSGGGIRVEGGECLSGSQARDFGQRYGAVGAF